VALQVNGAVDVGRRVRGRAPEFTRVPHTRADVEEGVVNLRGRVLSVVDLAACLPLGVTARARSARVVEAAARWAFEHDYRGIAHSGRRRYLFTWWAVRW
jgi:CheW-like domain